MGRSGGKRSLPRLAQRHGSPRVPKQTLPAAGSSCQRFLLWTPQPLPSRWGGPFRSPSGRVREGVSGAGLAGGSTLTQESARSELGRREPELGRRGRARKTRPPRGRPAPDDTLPAPDPACPPAAPETTAVASLLTQSAPGLQSISRALVCATFSTPTLLSSHAWGSPTSIFLS